MQNLKDWTRNITTQVVCKCHVLLLDLDHVILKHSEIIRLMSEHIHQKCLEFILRLPMVGLKYG